jgi:hypothetical protein
MENLIDPENMEGNINNISKRLLYSSIRTNDINFIREEESEFVENIKNDNSKLNDITLPSLKPTHSKNPSRISKISRNDTIKYDADGNRIPTVLVYINKKLADAEIAIKESEEMLQNENLANGAIVLTNTPTHLSNRKIFNKNFTFNQNNQQHIQLNSNSTNNNSTLNERSNFTLSINNNKSNYVRIKN